jgi:hypothetical protein
MHNEKLFKGGTFAEETFMISRILAKRESLFRKKFEKEDSKKSFISAVCVFEKSKKTEA